MTSRKFEQSVTWYADINNKCVSKTHISPYAQLIPGGVVHGPLKGTKHICNQCNYTGNFWRWSAHVSARYRVQTTELRKKNKIVTVMFWPTVYKSQERYAGINGTVAQGRNPPLFLAFIVCRDSLSFLRYKEVNSKNCQKSSNYKIVPVMLWSTL